MSSHPMPEVYIRKGAAFPRDVVKAAFELSADLQLLSKRLDGKPCEEALRISLNLRGWAIEAGKAIEAGGVRDLDPGEPLGVYSNNRKS